MNELTLKDLKGPGAYWCSGCGDFGTTEALKREILHLVNELGWSPWRIALITGIGCSSKTPEEFKFQKALTAIHSQHGELVAVAVGFALARPDFLTIGLGGDGDGYGIGMPRFIHAMRRNVNMNYFVDNNQVYGLTKGQASQTAHLGLKTISTPEGVKIRQFEPLEAALVHGAAYVARGVSWTPNPLSVMMDHAIQTKGFSFIDIFSPCVTYHREPEFPRGGNPKLLVEWYKKNYSIDVNEVYKRTLKEALTEEERDKLVVPDYNPRSPNARLKALELIQEARKYDRRVIGELCIDESAPTFQELLGVSVDRPLGPKDDPMAWKERCQELLAKLD